MHFPIKSGLTGLRPTGYVKAVDDLTFEIAQGETLTLVGESGCGKTTTAKVVLSLERPSAGRVLFEGKDVHGLKGADYRWYRRRVQAVFQDPWGSLNPRLRVKNTIAESLLASCDFSRKEIKERVERVLNDVGLDSTHGDRFPHEFSGGQRQRIAVAAAIVSEPSLVILDEPVSSLDVSIRAQIMNLLRDIQKKYQVSYLQVVHDLGTARYMSDKIAVMYLGRIVEYAATEELFNNPLHPYTEALFSAALPSHPDDQREEIVLEGEVPSPISPPSGCPFHTRCPRKIGPVCEKVVPALNQQENTGHLVACHLYA